MNAPNINFRLAAMHDAKLLLEWRNDEETRARSLSPDLVSMASHLDWLRASLNDPKRKLWIGEIDQNPIGTVRFDLLNNNAEMSWTLAPALRNKGLGKKFLEAAVELFSGDLVAKIKTDNFASLKIAQSVGFQKMSESDGVSMWRLKKN